MILLLVTTILFALIRQETRHYFAVAASLAIIAISWNFRLDHRLKSFLFVNQKVLSSNETWYGNVTITENSGQYNFFGNGTLLYTTDNTISSEEYTHYALMQHGNPKDILLVSGGIAGMIAEILKYKSVESVDYVELNPKLIGLASKYSPLPDDQRVHLIFDDGRRTIQRSSKKYDVAILAVPDPSSLQINRFYTDEFMAILKRKLNPGAVVLYALSSSGNYMSAEKKQIGTAFFQTLKHNFPRVEIIPGERDYFIASDSALRVDIARLSASKGIGTKYVNAYYIDDNSVRQRGNFIRENLAGNTINLDDKPLPVYFHTLQFISKFSSNGWILMLIPLIILLLPLFFMRSVAMGMYISGFTASSFEILIIFTFQTFFGYVYSAIGLIIAIFMGGLAAGSIYANRFTGAKRQFIAAQALLFLYSLAFPFFWILQKNMENSVAGLLLFGLVTLILSAVVGFQYVTGTKILPGNFTRTAPLLYAVDLIGAALGTIIISVILLPLAGMINSCLIMAGLNLLIALCIAAGKIE
jgi:spermidine synthase